MLRIFLSAQNVTLTGPPSLKLYAGSSNPSNVLHANVGELYLQSNSGIGYLWQKTAGSGMNNGWTQLINTSTVPTVDTTVIATHAYVQNWVTGHAWGLTGNAGTDPATNLIGTTDGAGLSIRAVGDSTQINFSGGHHNNINTYSNNFTCISTDGNSHAFNVNYSSNSTPLVNIGGILKYDDVNNTEGDGKVLTSDASGNASWQLPWQAKLVHYEITAADSANQYFTVPVAWTTAFADTNYAISVSLQDYSGVPPGQNFWAGDIHNKTSAGFNAVFYIYGTIICPDCGAGSGAGVVINASGIKTN